MNPTTLEAPVVTLMHKELLNDDTLWGRLTARIRKDYEFQAHFGELGEVDQINWSERILNETLGFLKLCSLGVGRFGPSSLVDIGWHTFMLYSRAYMDFCDEVNSDYIHHEPNDILGVQSVTNGPTDTVEAMVEHGIEVDRELWDLDSKLLVGCDSGPAQNCTCS